MERIDIREKVESGKQVEKIIHDFLSQIIQEDADSSIKVVQINHASGLKNHLEVQIDKKLMSIEVVERVFQPSLIGISVYAVLGEGEINLLTSFETDYMTFKKEEREFESVKFDVYNISFKEEGYKAGVNFYIVKEGVGAEYAKKILMAEEEIALAKEAISSIKEVL